MQAQLCPYQASLRSTILCKRRPVLPLFALFPPPAHVGGRVGAWECELDPALTSQAANCYCSLDTKHNSFLVGINSVILHITQLLCSAMQLVGKGNQNDYLRFINLKRDSNEQMCRIQSIIISEIKHLFQMQFNFLNKLLLVQIYYVTTTVHVSWTHNTERQPEENHLCTSGF